jgi:hypothetical protein
MMSDMESMAGAFGARGTGRGGGGLPPPPAGLPDGGPPPGMGMFPDGGPPGGGPFGGGAAGEFFPRTPVYVPSTVQFEGQTWQYVGIRFKGDSSLSTTWIPWDHDLSLQAGRGGDLLHTSTTAAWPLIRYLLDDPEYGGLYKTELQAAIDGVLAPASAAERFARPTS